MISVAHTAREGECDAAQPAVVAALKQHRQLGRGEPSGASHRVTSRLAAVSGEFPDVTDPNEPDIPASDGLTLEIVEF